MTTNIIIGGALANTHGRANTRDLANFLAEGTDDWDLYVFSPKPGSIIGAVFDWQAILSTTADLISIGTLLWAAYERFIKPICNNDKNSRSFFI